MRCDYQVTCISLCVACMLATNNILGLTVLNFCRIMRFYWSHLLVCLAVTMEKRGSNPCSFGSCFIIICSSALSGYLICKSVQCFQMSIKIANKAHAHLSISLHVHQGSSTISTSFTNYLLTAKYCIYFSNIAFGHIETLRSLDDSI